MRDVIPYQMTEEDKQVLGVVDTLPKHAWGPHFWKMLHLLSESFPADNPTDYDRSKYKELVELVCELLPCMECRKHANIYLQANRLKVTDRESLAMYLFNFHNEVNERLGKRKITLDEYKHLRSRCWQTNGQRPSIVMLTFMSIVLIALALLATEIYRSFH